MATQKESTQDNARGQLPLFSLRDPKTGRWLPAGPNQRKEKTSTHGKH